MIMKFIVNLILMQLHVIEIALGLKVYPLLVVPLPLKRTRLAEYFPLLFILVNCRELSSFSYFKIKEITRHEVRHHWQFLNHRRTYMWWINHRSIYERYYKAPVCWPEEDARKFSRLDQAFWHNDPKLNTDDLEDLYQRGLL